MANQAPVAIITGASRGIGKACGLALADKGYDIVACARTVESGELQEISETLKESIKKPLPGSLRETVDAVRAKGRQALGVKVDLLRNSDIDAMVKQVMAEFGRIDLVVNNARWIGQGFRDMWIDTPHQVYEESMQVNVLAPLYLLKLAVPAMVKQGGGIVVHIGSGAGHREVPALPEGDSVGGWGLSYSITKAAFNRIAAGLGKELKRHNIAVINMEPGSVGVERKAVQRGDLFNPEDQIPPEAIGRVCAYLATCKHPMYYSGTTVNGPEFAIDHGLIEPERMPPPHDMARWGLPNRPGGLTPG